MELLDTTSVKNGLWRWGITISLNEWNVFFKKIRLEEHGNNMKLLQELDMKSYFNISIYPPIGFVGKSIYDSLSHPQKIAFYEFLMDHWYQFKTKESQIQYRFKMNREMIRDILLHPIVTFKMLSWRWMPANYLKNILEQEEWIDWADLVKVINPNQVSTKVTHLLK